MSIGTINEKLHEYSQRKKEHKTGYVHRSKQFWSSRKTVAMVTLITNLTTITKVTTGPSVTTVTDLRTGILVTLVINRTLVTQVLTNVRRSPCKILFVGRIGMCRQSFVISSIYIVTKIRWESRCSTPQKNGRA